MAGGNGWAYFWQVPAIEAGLKAYAEKPEKSRHLNTFKHFIMKSIRFSLVGALLLSFLSCQKESLPDAPQVISQTISSDQLSVDRDGPTLYQFGLLNPTSAYAFSLEVRVSGERDVVAEAHNYAYNAGNQFFNITLDPALTYNATLTIWAATAPGKLDWRLRTFPNGGTVCAKGSQNYVQEPSAAVYFWQPCM